MYEDFTEMALCHYPVSRKSISTSHLNNVLCLCFKMRLRVKYEFDLHEKGKKHNRNIFKNNRNIFVKRIFIWTVLDQGTLGNSGKRT